MRTFVHAALAVALTGAPSLAGENEWSSLDQEINNLSSSLSAQNTTGPKIGGFIRTSFRYSDDTDALFGGPPNDEEEMGFKLDKVRVEISGDLGQDYAYKISFELRSGTASLRDAYVTWQIQETVKMTMGRFKKPFIRSGLVTDKNLLFMERTAIGGFFDAREEGLMFSGSFDTVEWWLAGQNGIDGKNDDFNWTARLVSNLMGAGAGKVEGAYGSGEETNLMAGLAYGDEGEYDDGAVIALEAYLTAGPLSVGAEIADFDEGTGGSYLSKAGDPLQYGSPNSFVSADPADSTPWDVTVSYMFTDMYEAAARYETADDDDDTTAWTVGVNRYVQGHDIKWTLQVLNSDSDLSSNEITEWSLGLTVGI